MKSLLLLLLTVCLYCPAQAQIYIGPELGLDASNLRMESRGTTYSNKAKSGFRGGITVGLEFNSSIFLMTGLTYVPGGSNIFFSDLNGSYATHFALNTLHLPVYISYQTRPSAFGRFMLGLGPHLGYILNGKVHSGTRRIDLSIGHNAQRDDLKPLDFGVGGYAGYRVNNGLFFRVQYQYGLADLSPQAGGTIRSRNLALTAGYLLQTGRKPSRERTLP